MARWYAGNWRAVTDFVTESLALAVPDVRPRRAWELCLGASWCPRDHADGAGRLGIGGAGGPVKNDGTARALGLSSWIVGNIYADPCQWGDGLLEPPVGPSVDDLADALAKQPMRNGTTPTAVTVDGYDGKYLELTIPADLDLATCSKVPGASASTPGAFVSWVGPAGDDYMGFAGPGSHDRVWILDVDGVRLVLDATDFPQATAADRAELQSIIDSIQIQPLSATASPSPTASP